VIPIIINNRNRVSTLKKLIDSIPKNNTRIIVLDNDSTFEPLLDYYSELPKEITLVKLNSNLGQQALYRWDGYKNLEDQYFIYTDSDLVVSEDCPNDFLEILLETKKKYKQYNKIGLGLRIDDLPNHYAFKQKVIDWELQYCNEFIYDDEFKVKFWIAPVDTTFAMYDKKNNAGLNYSICNCLRTDFPYMARHLPWYTDSSNLDTEEKYYMKNATAKFMTAKGETLVGHWTHIHKEYQATKGSLM